MRKTKNILGITLAASLMATFTLTALAAPENIPSASDTATVSIADIEETADVTAYRIIEPVYYTEGLLTYNKISGIEIADIGHPTANEVMKISKSIINGTLTPTGIRLDRNTDNEKYQAELPAGSYIILVTGQTGDAGAVYNPMLVSAYYSDASSADSLITAGDLSADTFYDTAYAKKTTVAFDKTILHTDGESAADNDGTGI